MADSQSSTLLTLYNSYRTALLNRKYYGYRLASAKKSSQILDIALAIGTSSAIGAWAIFKGSPGSIAWAILSGMATLIAIIKPTLGLPKYIERYTKLFVGHGDIYYTLDRIVKDIQVHHHVDDTGTTAYKAALDRIQNLAEHDDPNPNHRLLRKCYHEVNRELPADDLWYP